MFAGAIFHAFIFDAKLMHDLFCIINKPIAHGSISPLSRPARHPVTQYNARIFHQSCPTIWKCKKKPRPTITALVLFRRNVCVDANFVTGIVDVGLLNADVHGDHFDLFCGTILLCRHFHKVHKELFWLPLHGAGSCRKVGPDGWKSSVE